MMEWMGIIAMRFMNKILYLISEGFKSIFTHGFMSFASITIIVACLTIMGSFFMLIINIDSMITRLEQENEMLAFVDIDLSEMSARAIQNRLENVPNVSKVVFMSREEAMEKFKSDYDNPDIFSAIEPSVFRHRYVIFLEDIALKEETQMAVLEIDGIADVSAQLEISRGFVMVRNIVGAISLTLIAILFIVSVFIMSNTVKLTTFGRREEIAIMKMVGATNSFIRTPFVVEGLVLGVVGSGLAFLLQWGIYTLISDSVMAGIAGYFVEVVPFSQMMMPVGLAFFAVGVIVGAFGGSIAIRNYLKV